MNIFGKEFFKIIIFRQLMSYSGEWIYSQRTNLRKDSTHASEIIRNSLTNQTGNRHKILHFILFYSNKNLFF